MEALKDIRRHRLGIVEERRIRGRKSKRDSRFSSFLVVRATRGEKTPARHSVVFFYEYVDKKKVGMWRRESKERKGVQNSPSNQSRDMMGLSKGGTSSGKVRWNARRVGDSVSGGRQIRMRAGKGKGQEKRARNRFGESEVGATDPARHPFGLFKFGRRRTHGRRPQISLTLSLLYMSHSFK